MTTLCYKNVNEERGLYTTNILIIDLMMWKYENQTCPINDKLVTKQFTINI